MRKLLVVCGLLAVVVGLNACSSVNSLVYDGKERPVDEIEEIIADKLEVENPDYDLEVNIYQESETN